MNYPVLKICVGIANALSSGLQSNLDFSLALFLRPINRITFPFGLLLAFTVFAIRGAASSAVATFSTLQPFVMDGHTVAMPGVTSWPVLAGDDLTTWTAPATLSFPDGSTVVMASRSRVTISHSMDAPKLTLMAGKLDYKLAPRSRVTVVAMAPQLAGKMNLSLIPIEGEGAINNIKQRTAREVIVEVDDENHKPVRGVLVRFSVAMQPGGPGGTFAGGSYFFTATTDASGRAVARDFKTNAVEGAFVIAVAALYLDSIVATLSIHETNSLTLATTGDAATGAAGPVAAGPVAAGPVAAGPVAAGPVVTGSAAGASSAWVTGALTAVVLSGAGLATAAVVGQVTASPQ